MLNQLQAKLCKDLDELAHVFAESFKDRVGISVIAMGKLLFEVKGGGHGQAIAKSEVTAAADGILQPLMDLLDGSLSMYAEICDKSVLKRLLKELWKIVMRSLERNIVLPPSQDKAVSVISIQHVLLLLLRGAIHNLFISISLKGTSQAVGRRSEGS